jgi:hypothetical protein
MMEDFHDSAQRAGEVLAAAASAEAEARSTRAGHIPCGSTTLEAATGGGGGVPSGSATPQVATGGGRLVGLRCSLSDTAPEPAAVGRDHHPRYPLTCPTHHIRAAQRAAAATKRKEHQGPPRPMKRDRI